MEDVISAITYVVPKKGTLVTGNAEIAEASFPPELFRGVHDTLTRLFVIPAEQQDISVVDLEALEPLVHASGDKHGPTDIALENDDQLLAMGESDLPDGEAHSSRSCGAPEEVVYPCIEGLTAGLLGHPIGGADSNP